MPAAQSNGVQLRQQKDADDVTSSIAWEPIKAIVVRGGKVSRIDAAELVPGDVVHLSQGQATPADIQVVQITSGTLSMDQSAITGESEAIYKSVGDQCYVPCGVLSGDAFGVVTGIGYGTFVGRVQTLVQGVKDPGKGKDRDLNRVIGSVGTVLWTLVLCAILMCFRTKQFAAHADFLRTFVSCTMICVWAGGRGSVTNMRAIAVGSMAKQGAVVQSISDIDALAGVDVLCSDITGTDYDAQSRSPLANFSIFRI